MRDTRFAALQTWISSLFLNTHFQILPLAGDASFRRYFRVKTATESFVAMDAPPEMENCDTFIAMHQALSTTGVRVPTIFSSNRESGFLLLSDFGDRPLLSILNENNVDHFYDLAMKDLWQLQSYRATSNNHLLLFDAHLFWKEFDIFSTWYLKKQCGFDLSHQTEGMLKNTYQKLIDSANAQPHVLVHRDYHSRNLMCCEDGQFGILDFQDAVCGPITYDLVSLLKDCYVTWPVDRVQRWTKQFYELWQDDKNTSRISFDLFLKWFDWMGLQRHIKCLGIFSRLAHRDQKQLYLKEIPRVLNYVMTACDRYSEFSELKHFLQAIEKTT